jgi:hypothetical protein
MGYCGKGRLLEQARLSASFLPPSADQQLAFLAKLQRLFAEGDFAATYKFALLIALADLAVEIGADDGAELILTNRQIAERFIQRHAHIARAPDRFHALDGGKSLRSAQE